MSIFAENLNLGEAIDASRKRSINNWLAVQTNLFLVEQKYSKFIEAPFELTEDEVVCITNKLNGKPSETWDVNVTVSLASNGNKLFHIVCKKKQGTVSRSDGLSEKKKADDDADLEILPFTPDVIDEMAPTTYSLKRVNEQIKYLPAEAKAVVRRAFRKIETWGRRSGNGHNFNNNNKFRFIESGLFARALENPDIIDKDNFSSELLVNYAFSDNPHNLPSLSDSHPFQSIYKTMRPERDHWRGTFKEPSYPEPVVEDSIISFLFKREDTNLGPFLDFIETRLKIMKLDVLVRLVRSPPYMQRLQKTQHFQTCFSDFKAKKLGSNKASTPAPVAASEDEALFFEFMEEVLRHNGVAFLMPLVRMPEFKAYARNACLSHGYFDAFRMFMENKAAKSKSYDDDADADADADAGNEKEAPVLDKEFYDNVFGYLMQASGFWRSILEDVLYDAMSIPLEDKPDEEEVFLEFLSDFLYANGVGYLVPAVCTPGFMAYARRNELPSEYLQAFELFKERKAEEKRKEASTGTIKGSAESIAGTHEPSDTKIAMTMIGSLLPPPTTSSNEEEALFLEYMEKEFKLNNFEEFLPVLRSPGFLEFARQSGDLQSMVAQFEKHKKELLEGQQKEDVDAENHTSDEQTIKVYTGSDGGIASALIGLKVSEHQTLSTAREVGTITDVKRTASGEVFVEITPSQVQNLTRVRTDEGDDADSGSKKALDEKIAAYVKIATSFVQAADAETEKNAGPEYDRIVVQMPFKRDEEEVNTDADMDGDTRARSDGAGSDAETGDEWEDEGQDDGEDDGKMADVD